MEILDFTLIIIGALLTLTTYFILKLIIDKLKKIKNDGQIDPKRYEEIILPSNKGRSIDEVVHRIKNNDAEITFKISK